MFATSGVGRRGCGWEGKREGAGRKIFQLIWDELDLQGYSWDQNIF